MAGGVLAPFELWESFKDWLAAAVHLTHHGLHVVLGLTLTLLFTRLLRLPLDSWQPLAIVAGLEGVNEAFDFGRYHLSGWPWTPGPTLIDIALTLGPPLTLITVAALLRHRPGK
jgi:hypothetical protein